ncbi:hypothetical protein PGTUg99_003030 [Puccinia graminis f. sp. tritici]|uniref:Uncharacterized protein n=1 Tax=Puccinia graminis f. sp. tritici TaxID=56615 RepID=A0A5B0RDF5_PUCGR|nr:hypothetical protein PGTUg99_003030 [Puccinia graminis f. sp. tritici]
MPDNSSAALFGKSLLTRHPTRPPTPSASLLVSLCFKIAANQSVAIYASHPKLTLSASSY